MKKQKGFTLVELLVVIAIVAILAGAVLIAINPAEMMKKARDVKRIGDMDTVVHAIRLGLAEGNIVLQAGTVGPFASTVANARNIDCSGWVRCTGTLAVYMATLPIDPLNVAPNVYKFKSVAATGFEVNAILESAAYNGRMTGDGGNELGAYETGTNLTIITAGS